jgi:thiamine biosynthesis lipoprotein
MRAERTFRAMSADVHVVVVDGHESLLDRAQSRIDELERRWSRFLPGSEISALNRDAGRAVRVSSDTRELVEHALEAWRVTGGVYDPTVLGDLLRAGYDRSFEDMQPRERVDASDLHRGAGDIRIDGDLVQLPLDTGFDPGGIGKGLAADFVTRELLDAGATGVCVSVGGDVRVAGSPSAGDAWTIDVHHPDFEAPIARLGVRDGAVATSTTLRRRWTVGHEPMHHLIDTRTGRPANPRFELATVVSGAAWTADVLAKTLILDRHPEPFTLLHRTAAEGLVVDNDHNVIATAGLAAFTEQAA